MIRGGSKTIVFREMTVEMLTRIRSLTRTHDRLGIWEGPISRTLAFSGIWRRESERASEREREVRALKGERRGGAKAGDAKVL